MDVALAHGGLSWLAGSLSTLSPCVFPLLPLVLGGLTPGNRLGPLAMGAGMALSFALLGVLLGAAGPALGWDSRHVRTAAAVLLMLMGAWIGVPSLNEWLSQRMTFLASGAHAWAAHLNGQTLASAFWLGGLLGLIWSPCSGPLLASALIMAASDGGAASGAVTLGLFGLGAATPLVLAAYVSRAFFESVRQRVLAQGDKAHKIMGGALLLTGLAVLTGADQWLEAQILPFVPTGWLQLMTRF